MMANLGDLSIAKRQTLLWCGILLIPFLLASCAPFGPPIASGSYLYIGSAQTDLMQVDATGNTIAGEITGARIVDYGVETTQASYTGTVNGGIVHLNVSGGDVGITSGVGHVTDKGFSLSQLRASALTTMVFLPGTSAAFNRSIATLRGMASEALSNRDMTIDGLWSGPIAGTLALLALNIQPSGTVFNGNEAQFTVSAAASITRQSMSFSATLSGSQVNIVGAGANAGLWQGTITGGLLKVQSTGSSPTMTATLAPTSQTALNSSVVGETALLDGTGSGSCTIGYPSHNAEITLSGPQPDGNSAGADCAVAVSLGYMSLTTPANESGVCVEGAWGSWADVVRDTGEQIIGTRICSWLSRDGGPAPTFLTTPPTWYPY